jgi:hypothetical protein
MHRYLVVANQTLGGPDLARLVRERLEGGVCRFHIVVPATPPNDHWTYTEGEARYLALSRLETAIAKFSELGADVDGEIGDPRPLDAIADALRGEVFDGIIVSTLPPGRSRWLKMDLPARVKARFGLRVTHVVWAPEVTSTLPSRVQQILPDASEVSPQAAVP